MSQNLNHSEAENLRLMVRRMQRSIRTATPGVVTGFDAATQLAQVQPAIRRIQTIESERTPVDLPAVINVPVIFPYAQTAGIALTMPVQVGDEVLLIISDRSIDNWLDNGGVQDPHEPRSLRAHNITDSLAIVGCTPSPLALPNYQTDAAELRNRDRTSRVRVNDDQVQLVFGGNSITLSSSGIDIQGNISHTGDQTTSGTLTGETDVLSGPNNISGANHTHTSTAPGTPTSGPLP